MMAFIGVFENPHLSIAAAAIFALLTAVTMGLFSKNKMPVEGKVRYPPFPLRTVPQIFVLTERNLQTVLITGASEGMGLSVACQLAAKGANVVIISRSAEKLEKALSAVQVCLPHNCGRAYPNSHYLSGCLQIFLTTFPLHRHRRLET